MPYIKQSSYKAPILFTNAHVNTIFPNLFRKIWGIRYDRQRVDTPDGDFLDLDWIRNGSKHLVIIKHGLEGNSERPYTMGMARYFSNKDWDVLAFNFRSCSGELNRKLQSYHMGWTQDLRWLVKNIQANGQYESIALVGFSLGGNVILKYLGEEGKEVSPLIKSAVAFSVPCHIPTCNIEFNKPRNKVYMWRFMRSLNAKTLEKMKDYPGQVQLDKKNLPKRFQEFDQLVTAPVHGFASNMDYWKKNSSLQTLHKINCPTLLVNAADDTFLSPECYPKHLATSHDLFHLEIPKHGGHVGFTTFGNKGNYWSEERAYQFISDTI